MIHRIALPPHQSGMVDQSRAFFAFARAVVRLVESSDFDLVFATSSRLMTAVLGAWIARKKKAILYLDIRDIFVDTIKDVLPRHLTLVAKPLLTLLERWAVNRADKVNLVSEGFAGYFTIRYPHLCFSYFTNGIDEEFIAASLTANIKRPNADGLVNVIYAGNLGEGQGLHSIVPELAKRMRGVAHFKIIGDGGRKEVLRAALTEAGVDNVELLPPVNRDHLIKAYQEADVLFIHLNDYDAFKKVLPSKLFEYGAMGKPIWAGVSGYAAEFIKSEIANTAVFNPCDIDGAVSAFEELTLQDAPRTTFIAKYARANISNKMAEDILAVASGEA